jgi:hypothetical protein
MYATDDDPPARLHWLTGATQPKPSVSWPNLSAGSAGCIWFPKTDLHHCGMGTRQLWLTSTSWYPGWLDAKNGKTGTAF